MQDTYKWVAANAIVGVLIYPLDTLKTVSQINKITNIRHIYNGFSHFLLQRVIGKGSSFYVFTNICPLRSNWGYKQMSAACVATAAISSLYSTPLELLKIRRQTGIKTKVLCKKSLLITFVRDVVAIGLYFPIFITLQGFYGSFMSGGIAGVTAAVGSYPFEMIKTCIQTRSRIPYCRLYTGMQYALIKAFLSHGITFHLFSVMN